MRFPRPLLAATAAVVTAVVLAACSGGTSDDAAPTSLRVGFTGSGFNPTATALHGVATDDGLYEPLVAIDGATSQFVPVLATEFEVAEDRMSITFELRDDVDFTDGTHLDAAAVADYFDLILTGETADPAYKTWIASVEATDEYILEIATAQAADAGLFELLGRTGIVSPVAAEDPDALLETPVGTGPYLLDELAPGVSASYVRNPDYRDPRAYDFDTYEELAFADDIAASNALKSGQVDAIYIGSSSLLPDLEAQGFEVAESGGTYRGLVILDFEGDIVPALGDVRVRQAIAMAFDQEAIATQIELGYATVSDQGFGAADAAYVEGGDNRYAYDVEAAKALLAEAGYADGFAITIPAAASVAFYPKDFEPIIQQSLGDLGITVTFEQFPDAGALVGAWLSGDYPVFTSNLGYTYTIGQFQGATPGLGGHFDDDATFHELTTIMREGTQEEYDAAAAELGEYMLEQAWFLPLSHISAIRVVHTADVDVAPAKDRFSVRLIDFSLAD